jgi:S1-C subfamily serine protease
VDEAIGIARYFSADFPSVRVIKTNAGIYAVTVGPERTASIQAFREQAKNVEPIPEDAFLSRGDSWTEVVWRKRSPILAEVHYDGKDPAILRYGTISISVSRTPDIAAYRNGYVPVLTGRVDDKTVFTMRGTSGGASDQPHAHVFLVNLDRRGSAPQVVMTAFTGGAHCCTETHIATSDSDGRWSVLKTDTLDGDGYEFEDIGADGVSELVSVDNSFLYAFDCYACSYAPVRVHKLEGSGLRDVRRDYPRFLRQDLYRMEYSAERTRELWHSNGFLGGWVAANTLIGQFDNAWARMLVSYDRKNDWSLEECTTGAPLDKCPVDSKKRLSFPEALRKHLIAHGYIEGQEPSPAVVHAVPPEPATRPSRPSENDEPPAPEPTAASGSGYVITSDGYLITNAHVVQGCRNLTVSIAADRVQARVIARDPVNDLALLASDLKPKSIAPLRTNVRLGESVAVFGFPLHGLLATSGNFTLGNVTAVAGVGDDSRMVQISAPVQPGNSGGPLLDQAGNVVGTVVAKINAIKLAQITNDLAENLNFAIKSSIVTAFLEANGITFRSGSLGDNVLSPPDLADRARDFSASVECRL